jgi:hypothetical protein
MHRQAFDFIAARARDLGRVGFVLEIGARNINGTVRNLFDAERYVGLDVSPGPGVDVVASGADYVPETPADVIVCCEVLEHTEEAAAICRRSIENLAPGGVLLLTMAGTGRAPHSAIDGCDLREGEFYRNVSAANLQEWLADADCTLTVGENPAAGDTYALAQKHGLGARLSLPANHATSLKSVLLWYPGSAVSTSDVAAGLQFGLEQAGVKVIPYKAEVEIAMASVGLTALWQKQGAPEDRRPNEADKIYRASKAVLADAVRARIEHGVEWVFVVSGMYQHPDFYVFLRNCGFKVALFCTETPYDIEFELRACRHVDAVFTNERAALDVFRAVHPRVEYLPHAWHPGVHSVMTEASDENVPSHDVVFVGTYFQERIDFLASGDWSGIDLGLYGGTEDIEDMAGLIEIDPEWSRLRQVCMSSVNAVRRWWWKTTNSPGDTPEVRAARRLLPYVRGRLLRNAKTAALYRRAKVGLNFHRTSKGYGPHVQRITHAESLNPRCYELAATGCYFVTDARDEAKDIFGDALDTFSSPKECESLIRRALSDESWRKARSEQCQRAVQPHTWVARTQIVLDAVARCRTQVECAA